MKTGIQFFTVLTLLCVSSYTQGLALQQDMDILGKATLTDNIVSTPSLTANVANTVPKAADAKVERDTSYNMIDTRYKAAFERLKQQGGAIKEYARANNYNSDYAFLLDMSIPSGKNRFFVYNLKADSLECSSLVAHGFGSTVKDSEDQLLFSNNNFSFKTSLGRYKIGNPYNGTYGLAYKLYGLDSSNSKAYQRAIVLHADTHVPETETYPYKIFQSAGCPTVSKSFLPVLSNYIKTSQKPILMWIYY